MADAIEFKINMNAAAANVYRDVAKGLDAANRRSVELAASLGGGMKAGHAEMNKFNELTQRTTRSVKGIDDVFGGLGRTLTSPVGLAAAFTSAAKSLTSFARTSVQMRVLARDTGFTREQFNNFAQAIERSGQTWENSKSIVEGWGKALDRVYSEGPGSDFYTQLRTSPAGGQLANILQQKLEQGDRYGVMLEVLRWYSAQNKEGKAYFRTIFNSTDTILGTTLEEMKKNVALWKGNEAQLKAYDEAMIDLKVTTKNVWNDIRGHVIGQLIELKTEFGLTEDSAKHFSVNFKAFLDENVFPFLKTTFEEANAISDFVERHKLITDVAEWIRTGGGNAGAKINEAVVSSRPGHPGVPSGPYTGPQIGGGLGGGGGGLAGRSIIIMPPIPPGLSRASPYGPTAYKHGYGYPTRRRQPMGPQLGGALGGGGGGLAGSAQLGFSGGSMFAPSSYAGGNYGYEHQDEQGLFGRTWKRIIDTVDQSNKSLIEIHDSLLRMTMGGGSIGEGTLARGIGPVFRRGIGPGSIERRGAGGAGAAGTPYSGGDTPAPTGVGGALYNPVTGTALGGGLGAYRAGHTHAGDDIETRAGGSPLYAVKDGTIVSFNPHGTIQGDAAMRVVWDDGTWSYYMHHTMDQDLLRQLQKDGKVRVKGGQVLGMSGWRYVWHLHFEMHDRNGRIISPRHYFGWDKNNLPQGGQIARTSPVDAEGKSQVDGSGPSTLAKPLKQQSEVPSVAGTGDTSVTGVASWYQPGVGWKSGGGTTASGEPYSATDWNAAIQIGLRGKFGQHHGRVGYALVEAPDGRRVIVKINDVGPLTPGRVIDFNRRVAEHFGIVGSGTLSGVKVTALPGNNWIPGPVAAGAVVAGKRQQDIMDNYQTRSINLSNLDSDRKKVDEKLKSDPLKKAAIDVTVKIKKVWSGVTTAIKHEGEAVSAVTVDKSKDLTGAVPYMAR